MCLCVCVCVLVLNKEAMYWLACREDNNLEQEEKVQFQNTVEQDISADTLFPRFGDFTVPRILIFADAGTEHSSFIVLLSHISYFYWTAVIYFRGLDVNRENRENNMSAEISCSTVLRNRSGTLRPPTQQKLRRDRHKTTII